MLVRLLKISKVFIFVLPFCLSCNASEILEVKLSSIEGNPTLVEVKLKNLTSNSLFVRSDSPCLSSFISAEGFLVSGHNDKVIYIGITDIYPSQNYDEFDYKETKSCVVDLSEHFHFPQGLEFFEVEYREIKVKRRLNSEAFYVNSNRLKVQM